MFRWERRTRPFLRTTEFLWQEGHTAHASRADADTHARTVLAAYQRLCTDLLAVPVVAGTKSDLERFAGAEATYTLEAMMQNGAIDRTLMRSHPRTPRVSPPPCATREQAGPCSLPPHTSWDRTSPRRLT